jgi:hypothetical protein
VNADRPNRFLGARGFGEFLVVLQVARNIRKHGTQREAGGVVLEGDRSEIHVRKEQTKRIQHRYFRDDGELMIEMQPGEFVSETAVRRGLVQTNAPADPHRVKGRLRRTSRRVPKTAHA